MRGGRRRDDDEHAERSEGEMRVKADGARPGCEVAPCSFLSGADRAWGAACTMLHGLQFILGR